MLGGVLFLEGEGLLLRRGSVGYYRITVRSATCNSLSSSFVSTNYRYFRYYSVNTLAYVLSGSSFKSRDRFIQK